MKTKNWFIIAILGCAMLLSGCSKTYISVISKSPECNLSSGDLKTATVVGVDGLSLNEFTKTFNKKYRQNRDFIDEYINLVTNKLQMGKLFAQVKFDNSRQWGLMKSFAGMKEDFKIVDSLFTNCSSDYIINVSNFEISNRIQSFTSYGGPNMSMSSSSTEFCVINAQFQVIDQKTRKSILEFKSTGEGSVILFAFEAAFKNAVANSIDHAVAYLKTGKITF